MIVVETYEIVMFLTITREVHQEMLIIIVMMKGFGEPKNLN